MNITTSNLISRLETICKSKASFDEWNPKERFSIKKKNKYGESRISVLQNSGGIKIRLIFESNYGDFLCKAGFSSVRSSSSSIASHFSIQTTSSLENVIKNIQKEINACEFFSKNNKQGQLAQEFF